MREHLFRGFHPDTNSETIISFEGIPYRGYWVEGGITFDINKNYFICPERFSDYNEEIEVIPKTICEYSGLTDKNGKRIFENDIVTIKTESNNGNINGFTGVVKFHDCGFELQSLDDKDCYECFWYDSAELEIVSNVFENPELLK